MKTTIFSLISFLFLISIIGCGSSTGSRYETEKKEEEEKKPEVTKDVAEIFDMTPYRSEFNFNLKPENNDAEIWYGYEDSDSVSLNENNFTIKPGYRVEVSSTDNLDEANNVKSELVTRIKENIYIIFDPPFYRVRIGDFENRSSAENQSFRLRQLGFQESRVVSDSVKTAGN